MKKMGLSLKAFGFFLSILGCSMYLLPSLGNAQTGALTGQVTDGSAGILDIMVIVYDTNNSFLSLDYTDASGDYTVTGLPSGDHKVKFIDYNYEYITPNE